MRAEPDYNKTQTSRPGPGGDLQRAREAAGLSVDQLASRLHLSVSTIEDLEADDYTRLPQPAYIRGYLRSAARALDIDDAPLVQAFEAQGLSEPRLDAPPVLARTSDGAANRGHRRAPYLVGLVILLGLAALIGYGWFEGQDLLPGAGDRDASERSTLSLRTAPPTEPPVRDLAHDEMQGVPLPDQDPGTETGVTADEAPFVPPFYVPDATATPEPAVPVEPEPAMPQILLPTQPESQAAPETAPEPAPPAVDESPAEDSAPASAALSSVTLRFMEDSWVEISDARGENLLVGLMREGTERRLEGQLPYRVFLGNTPGVRIEVDGSTYDPARHARSDNTARFSLEAP
ncbi:MAG TPA: RodZ domain-containing protein [Thioalkalivibrio sp.]|nr:RodZ domain-containing protein [Thioalkalivibrio sp.]